MPNELKSSLAECALDDKMLSPVRAVVAVALVILLASTSLLAADVLQDASRLPRDARVGVPRHGDVAAYTVQSTPTPEWESPQPAVAFRWDGVREARDAWGRLLDMDHLVLVEHTRARNVSFARGDLTPLVVQVAAEGADETRTTPTPNGTQVTIEESDIRILRYPAAEEDSPRERFVPWHSLALARAGWQGVLIRDVPGAAVDTFAPFAEFLEGAFRDAGTSVVDGVPVQWIEADLREREGVARFALADGLPYPMAVVWDAGSPRDAPDSMEWPERTVTTFTLTGYRGGDGVRLDAVDPEAAARSEEAAQARVVPTRQGLPTEGDLDVPVPLADAWAAVRASEEYIQWTERQSVYGLRWVTWEARDGAWQFVFAAQDESLLFYARLRPDCDSAGNGNDCVVVEGQVAGSLGEWYGEGGRRLEIRGYAFPPEGITLAGALDAYRARNASGAPAGRVQFNAAAAWDDGSTIPAMVSVTPRPAHENWEELKLDFETGRAVEHSWFAGMTVVAQYTDPRTTDFTPTWNQSAREPVLPFEVPSRVYYATSGLALVLLVAAAVAERVPAAGALLYTRLGREDVLSNPRRAAILNAIRERPGLSAQEIATTVRASRNGTQYHLSVLARQGHVARVVVPPFTRWFLRGHAPPAVLREEAVRLNDGTEARVLDVVRAEPGIHAAAVAARLGVSSATVHGVVKRLVSRGLLRKRARVAGRVGLEVVERAP